MQTQTYLYTLLGTAITFRNGPSDEPKLGDTYYCETNNTIQVFDGIRYVEIEAACEEETDGLFLSVWQDTEIET